MDPNFATWFPFVGGAGMMAQRNHNHDAEVSAWDRPVSIGHLIVAILGLGATVIGGVFFDRLGQERASAETRERQNSVINVQLPQLRQEIADLHRVDRERDSQLAGMQREIEDIKLDLIKHERDDAAKFQAKRGLQ